VLVIGIISGAFAYCFTTLLQRSLFLGYERVFNN